jgi:hypothetical protein
MLEQKRVYPMDLKPIVDGNIFASGPGGIWIFNQTGTILGKDKNTGSNVANCALSPDEKTSVHHIGYVFVTFEDARLNLWSYSLPYARAGLAPIEVIAAYALNSYQKVKSDSITFQVLNLTGAIFLIINSIYKEAYPIYTSSMQCGL